MTQLTAVETPKTVMMSYGSKNRRRIEEDEKELEELMKKASAPENQEEEEEETSETEVKTEVKTEEEEPKEELSAEEKNWKKRYSDLRSHSAKQVEDLKKQLEAAKEGKPSGIAPPKSDEDIEAWAKKYPDVAGIVETIARKRAEEMFKGAEDKFKRLDELTYETKIAEATKSIREKHSDFETLKASDEFHTWAESQPKWVQDALYENEDDPQSVIRVIDLYKMDKGMTPQAKKAKAKDAASDVKVKAVTPKVDADMSGRTFRESQVMKMSDAEFEKNYEKILEAQQKGTFIYDVTKK